MVEIRRRVKDENRSTLIVIITRWLMFCSEEQREEVATLLWIPIGTEGRGYYTARGHPLVPNNS